MNRRETRISNKEKEKAKGYLGVPEVGGDVVASLTKLEGDDFVHGAGSPASLEFHEPRIGLA